MVEYRKSEVFHFSRSTKNFNPPSLDLSLLGGSILWLKVLQTQVLKVRQVNEPCIRLTQENPIENSVQDCLPYLLKSHGPC